MNFFKKVLRPNQTKQSPLLLCEECSFAAEKLFVVKKLFLCGECKKAEERRTKLRQAEKDFNNN